MRKILQVDFSSAEQKVMEALLERTITAMVECENITRRNLVSYERLWRNGTQQDVRMYGLRLAMAHARLPLEAILYPQFEALSGMLGKETPDDYAWPNLNWPNIHCSYTEGDDLLPVWLDMLNMQDRESGRYRRFDEHRDSLVKMFKM